MVVYRRQKTNEYVNFLAKKVVAVAWYFTIRNILKYQLTDKQNFYPANTEPRRTIVKKQKLAHAKIFNDFKPQTKVPNV